MTDNMGASDKSDRAVVNEADTSSSPTASIPCAVADALDDYNDLVRSLCNVAERRGVNTNWDSLERRARKVLGDHHKTWLIYSSFERRSRERMAWCISMAEQEGDAAIAAGCLTQSETNGGDE